MNRTNKYRGKRLDNGQWVVGSYWHDTRDIGKHCIWSQEELYWIEVDPATVGQFTSLHDDYKVEIYEGDITMFRGYPFVMTFDCGEFVFTGYVGKKIPENKAYYRLISDLSYSKVIGNIYDNPELIVNQ